MSFWAPLIVLFIYNKRYYLKAKFKNGFRKGSLYYLLRYEVEVLVQNLTQINFSANIEIIVYDIYADNFFSEIFLLK